MTTVVDILVKIENFMLNVMENFGIRAEINKILPLGRHDIGTLHENQARTVQQLHLMSVLIGLVGRHLRQHISQKLSTVNVLLPG